MRTLSLVAGLLLASIASANTYVVTTTADSGVGSLRWAINQANLNAGPDTIVFSIPSFGGVVTIQPLSPLPELWDNGTTIDGLTQFPASAGAQPPRTASLMVEIDGSLAGMANGIAVRSSDNVVRGLVIHSFQLEGIQVVIGNVLGGFTANNNVIYCNFVGTDPTGTLPQGNGLNTTALRGGIHLGNTTFGTVTNTLVEGNLVSDNWAEGIWIEGPRTPGDVGYNTVVGNFVGTDITGTVDLGNRHEGIALTEGTHDNVIRDNLVSGNDTDGIGLQGFNNVFFAQGPLLTASNLIEANRIGVDVNLLPLPNTMHGIAIGEYGPSQWGCANDNTIRRNVIANNGGAGIAVWEDSVDTFNADRNRITQNAIWDNGGLGIDLGNDSHTPNDLFDSDTGANEQMNFPTFSGATYSSGIATFTGTVTAPQPTLVTVELFKARPDPAGFGGQGEVYLGSVTPTPTGLWSFVTDRLAPGDLVTATATDAAGNTSEFSFNEPVPGTPTLTVDRSAISYRTGGVVNLTLSQGAARAGRQYVLLGGVSGVTPGTPLGPLGPITVPLNFDWFTNAAAGLINTPTFVNFFGTLDAAGNATAQFDANTLMPIPPVMVGFTMHYATLGLAPYDFTSNPVAIEVVGW